MSYAKFLSDRYFSVDLTTNIGDVKLSTNEVYGRNDLWKLVGQSLHDPTLLHSLDTIIMDYSKVFYTCIERQPMQNSSIRDHYFIYFCQLVKTSFIFEF